MARRDAGLLVVPSATEGLHFRSTRLIQWSLAVYPPRRSKRLGLVLRTEVLRNG
jgi:hypothetical protein